MKLRAASAVGALAFAVMVVGCGGGAPAGGSDRSGASAASEEAVSTALAVEYGASWAGCIKGRSRFVPVGSMTVPRYGHTATLLPNGKVLVAGGWDSTGAPLSSAELYDPRTRTFTRTGDMFSARSRHAAVLLPDGTVLIVGGSGNPHGDLYHPGTGQFTYTAGLMGTFRGGALTATLLRNGTVLIAGGNNVGTQGAVDTAETYDPRTQAFTAAGSMSALRSRHAATLLFPSGKVLISGGSNGQGGHQIYETAEVYDPVTRSFTSTGSMSTRRADHTATLMLDGRVLVAGGDISVYGGSLASAELYDPRSGSFILTGSLGQSRAGHGASWLPWGNVLMTGGDTSEVLSPVTTLTSAETYRLWPGRFSSAGDLRVARVMHTQTILHDGDVLIAGGRNAGGALASAELFR